MKKVTSEAAVEESIAEITKLEEQGKTEVIAGTRDEKLGDHRPFKQKVVDFMKSGAGKGIIVGLLILLTVLAVPMTRYALLGSFVKKQVIINVVDETTGKPVSDALVRYGRGDAKTDSKGVAVFDGVSVGDHVLSIEKKYYENAESSHVVPIFGESRISTKLKATGRVATIAVKDAISGKALSGADVKIGDTNATTDDAGTANVALATRNSDQPGTVSLSGFMSAEIRVNTKDISPSVDVALVPDGKAYFISNRTGSYDVMSSTLDGENVAVVIKGTGKELGYELQLMPSPDRSHIAYQTRRGNDTVAYIYMLDTATGALTKIDGSGGAGMIGWIEGTFYIGQYNYNNGVVVDKRSQLLGYAAGSKQLKVLDSSQLDGDQYNYAELAHGSAYQLVGDRIYYSKCWGYSNYYSGNQDRKASLMAVVDGKATVLKEVNQKGQGYCDTVATKPNIIYYRVTYTVDNHADSYRYLLGKAVEPVQVSDGELYNNRYTYLASPNGEKNLWTETRDGKEVAFVGDANGQNEQQVSKNTYQAYGWFGNEYVLYSKDGSELYVAAVGAEWDGAHKVADYYSQRGPGY